MRYAIKDKRVSIVDSYGNKGEVSLRLFKYIFRDGNNRYLNNPIQNILNKLDMLKTSKSVGNNGICEELWLSTVALLQKAAYDMYSLEVLQPIKNKIIPLLRCDDKRVLKIILFIKEIVNRISQEDIPILDIHRCGECQNYKHEKCSVIKNHAVYFNKVACDLWRQHE